MKGALRVKGCFVGGAYSLRAKCSSREANGTDGEVFKY